MQSWCTPFTIWNQCVVPCPVLTVALTCTQISQESGQVVWYSHLFKNFSQFVVIHTVNILKEMGIPGHLTAQLLKLCTVRVYAPGNCFHMRHSKIQGITSGMDAIKDTYGKIDLVFHKIISGKVELMKLWKMNHSETGSHRQRITPCRVIPLLLWGSVTTECGLMMIPSLLRF